jgi:3-dehydroquinate synthase
MKTITIDLGSISYPVYISENILGQLPEFVKNIEVPGRIYVIIDEFIYKKYSSEMEVFFRKNEINPFVLKGKKNNKTFYSAMKIFADLDGGNFARDTTIFAIGGGVIGDLAGFVSSCWYRGSNLVHIPTTLLSAVDSCLGGKTAINFKSTVNAIGSYHHPTAILIDSKLLMELPPREISSGFAEIVKYALLGAPKITECISEENTLSSSLLAWYVEQSLKQKERFVKNDISESANRLFLNFGHTIGHAIEFSTIYNGEETLRHGQGVALGMLAIFRICIELGYLEESDIKWLRSILDRYGLPIYYESMTIGLKPEKLVKSILNLTFKDKKRTNTGLRLILLDGIGNPFIYKTDNQKLIKFGIEEVIK